MDQYVLQIDWTEPDLPRLVGPFPSRDEAHAWGVLHIANGEWNVTPLVRGH